MKSLVAFISLILLVLFVFEKSGALTSVSYTVREGVIKVQRTRLEWHPEKLMPFFRNTVATLKITYLRLTQKKTRGESEKKGKLHGPQQILVLTNGGILRGHVARETEEGIFFETEDGELFFRKDEIGSLKGE